MADLKNSVRSSRLTLGKAFESLDRAVGDGHGPDASLARLEHALLKAFESVRRPRLLSRPIAIEILKVRGVTRISDLLQTHGIQAGLTIAAVLRSRANSAVPQHPAARATAT